ncbi:hypothetical protein PFICI_04220 [Pestalotiopsis fici W106-1]|uniref:Heterokaryon incompatibility domain-containing protein n=1 Tax=Pestalotiopsis fici (strain W106-1 / CGMCC3.15140) TaxID=1229662 RepID=W3X8J7_PESFW|nr:uncharacterized protein PFICI_04220 [Pestalotiopsis fici W106-1]ETS82344.1 hypothetical protein PFICI_04220 [Pestalotiopsis fici W106-1]
MEEAYSYTALPTPGHIRLLTLKASKSSSADLHGELVDYPLQECEGDLHCYEALSYVWGSNEKPRQLWIGNCKLDITESLYAALLRLRNRSADRSLWVDAICINQTDDDEKAIQVQRMAAVYSKASRVRVWLGEADAADGSNDALYCLAEAGAAEGPYELPDESLEPIRSLLARDWFKRVWVIQEVAAAQHVVIMCGATSIDGYAFCVGLQALHKSDKLPDLQEHIGSIVYLIRRSIFRLGKQNHQASQEESPTFSLNIRPLGQLIDMYRNRQATDQRDKVYALLGMSSEVIPQDLMPNYSDAMTWDALFSSLGRYIFGTEAHVGVVATNIAAVRIKCEILGHVSSLRPDEHRYDMQVLTIASWSTDMHAYDQREWIAPTSAVSVNVGDMVCLLDWGQNIAILRSETEFFRVVMTSGRWNAKSAQYDEVLEKGDKHELLLAWDWNSPEQIMPRFIDTIPAKSIITQHTNGITRRQIVVNALLSAYSDIQAESSLLDLEQEYQQQSSESMFAELDRRAKMVYLYLRTGRLDEAERRYKDIYQHAKAMARTEWLSQSISQYLKFFPTAAYPQKARIWGTLKSVIDENVVTPQHYIQTHRRLTDTLAKCTAAEASLLIDLGELFIRNPETTSMVCTRDNSSYVSEDIIKALEESVVEAIAGNSAFGAQEGRRVMELLLERKGDQVPITEAVVIKAASTYYQLGLLELLFEKRGDQVPITENVAAAGNDHSGREVMELLFEKKGDQIPITENVVKAAAGSRFGRKVMELLFEKSTFLTTLDAVKSMALNKAAAAGSHEVVELLLEKDADLTVPDPDGRTPLINASRNGRLEIVQQLFDRGADWRIPDSSGLDALQWAIWEDRYNVQDFLLSVGAVESDDVYGIRALFEEELTVLS